MTETQSPPPTGTIKTKTYNRRWIVISGVAGLILSAHLNFLTFTPIPYETSEFFNVTSDAVNLLAFINFPCGAVFGVLAMYTLDTFSIFWPLIISGWFIIFGGVLRIVSVYLSKPNFLLLAIGQILGSIGSPVFSLSSTKVADLWFPEDQTALANSLMTMNNPLAFLLAATVGPSLVTEIVPQKFQILLWIFTVPAIIGLILTHSVLRKDTKGEPPLPSKESSDIVTKSFWNSVKTIFTTKDWLLCVVTCGAGVGIFNVVAVNMPLILCPLGYSDTFSKTLAVTIIVISGVFGSVIVGKVISYWTKKDEQKMVLLAKSMCSFLILIYGAMAYILQIKCNYTIMIIALILFGFIAIPLLPVTFEFAVETTFPAGPATAAGFCWIVGQVLASVFSFIFKFTSTDLDESWYEEHDIVNSCYDKNGIDVVDKNFKNSLIICFATGGFLNLCFIVFFKCDFKRRAYNKLYESE